MINIMYNTHKSIYTIDNWFVSMRGYTKKKMRFFNSKIKAIKLCITTQLCSYKNYMNIFKFGQNLKLETKGLTLTINQILNPNHYPKFQI